MLDQPIGRPAVDPNHKPDSLSDSRRALTTMADTAGAMASELDSLREGGFSGVEDIETAANLRVELDQAAAAADDLHHALRDASHTSADSGW